MIIKHGQSLKTLTEVEVTHKNFKNITQSSLIVVLTKIFEHDFNINGSFEVPQGVSSIGGGAFKNCTSLTTIILPQSLTHINACAFEDCSSLTTIILPKSLTYIGCRAFYDCSSLTTINLPETLTHIGDRAFNYCSSLTTINLPETLTHIGYWPFTGCSSLTTIILPKTLTHIGEYAFKDCSSLTTIIIDTDSDDEVKRVKNMLPPVFRREVIKKCVYDEAICERKNAIVKLSATPQFSPLYKLSDYLVDHFAPSLVLDLDDSILAKISSFLINGQDLHSIFNKGKLKIESLPLPYREEELNSYKDSLANTVTRYKNIAEQKIRPSVLHEFWVAEKNNSYIDLVKLNLRYRGVLTTLVKGLKDLSGNHELQSFSFGLAVSMLLSITKTLSPQESLAVGIVAGVAYHQSSSFFAKAQKNSLQEEKQEALVGVSPSFMSKFTV